MPAYNSTELYNQTVQQQASEAFLRTCITEKSYKTILQSHPGKLYTPNYFIRIALGLVTIIAVLFTAILFGLLFASSGSGKLVALCFFLGISCYVTLELIVRHKHCYNAGIDNILMLSSIIFFVSAFFVYNITTDYMLISGTTMALSIYLCIRFADAFMAIISYLSFFLFIFFLYLKLGAIANISVPFLMMFLSGSVYLLMKNLSKTEGLMTYHFCIKSVMFLTLLTFYASSNYFIVKELSNQMFSPKLTINDGIPLGWLFWILTYTIPVIYILYGIRRKDFLFIRTGLGLIAATIFTIRYYYHIFPVEVPMLIAGTIIITACYVLIQYLKLSKHGYTSRNLNPVNKNLLNAEAFIIAQTFGTSAKTENNNLFKGGSGGGGGATGNF